MSIARLLLVAVLVIGPSTSLRAQASGPWLRAVAAAQDEAGRGRFAAAADLLRNARKASPDMPAVFVLQLVQYLVQHVTETPALSRAEASKSLAEATAIADELIKRKQEVRFAMMAKAMALQTQADRVEQTEARRASLRAEADKLSAEARFVNADGTAIPKTAADEWQELAPGAFVGGPPPKVDTALLEKFVARYPEFAPARIALGRQHEARAEGITDSSPKGVATRRQHLEQAEVQYKRAAEVATDRMDAASALDAQIRLLAADALNRPADAVALVRSSIAKYPEQRMLVGRLVQTLIPVPAAVTDAALRDLRAATPADPQAKQVVGTYLWDMVNRSKTLPREASARLLAEAVIALDGALKTKPDYMEAIVYKSIVLRLQADRVEQDPARAKALIAEADRLAALAKKLPRKLPAHQP